MTIDPSALTHDDLPPCPAPAAAPAPWTHAGGWRSRREEAEAARARLFWARVRAIHDPVDEEGRAGCRGEALLEDLRRAAPAAGWRALPEGDDDLALLQLAGALPLRGPAYVAALGRDPASGEPVVAFLREGATLPQVRWPRDAANRISVEQLTRSPSCVLVPCAPRESRVVPTEFLREAMDLLRAEVTARADAAARRASDRKAFVPRGAGAGSAVPLPDDEDVPF